MLGVSWMVVLDVGAGVQKGGRGGGDRVVPVGAGDFVGLRLRHGLGDVGEHEVGFVNVVTAGLAWRMAQMAWAMV